MKNLDKILKVLNEVQGDIENLVIEKNEESKYRDGLYEDIILFDIKLKLRDEKD